MVLVKYHWTDVHVSQVWIVFFVDEISVATGGNGKSWVRRSGALSSYDGGWPQEGKARKKFPLGYRDWGQETATSSKDGSQDAIEKEADGKAEKAPTTKGYTIQKEQIWELQRIFCTERRAASA